MLAVGETLGAGWPAQSPYDGCSTPRRFRRYGRFVELPNSAFRQGAFSPVISVLIPVFRRDPSLLLTALDACTRRPDATVEILVADDGSPGRGTARIIAGAIEQIALPVLFLRSPKNVGRAAIRNRLCDRARGEYVLFLDCDMVLKDPHYLENYLDAIRNQPIDVSFGGLAMSHSWKETAEFELYACVSQRSHCVSAAKRQEQASKYTYTCNLLVRRTLATEHPFCEEFRGWGWEDTEWALRVSKIISIRHLENPVLHDGVLPPEVMIARIEESIPNFQLICKLHPEEIFRYPLYRAAKIFSRVPFKKRIAAMLKAAVVDRRGAWPLSLRFGAFKLLNALYYHSVASGAADR